MPLFTFYAIYAHQNHWLDKRNVFMIGEIMSHLYYPRTLGPEPGSLGMVPEVSYKFHKIGKLY